MADHYLGVCNSRVPPNCSKTGGPEGSDPTPVTYTFIVDSEDAVNAWHEFLSAVGYMTGPALSTATRTVV